MASYHFSAQIIGRKAGRSSVGAAAYRAGERLQDERAGVVHDFSRRRGIAHQEIMLPDGAASWLADRAKLWNHVERIEKRKDAQLCREINLALPHEVSAEARLALVREFVQEQFVSRGMVADVAWHVPVPEKGDNPRNFHAHVMLTLRQALGDGLRSVKTREWNSDTLMEAWRAAWAEHQNRALERAGVRGRVDHRSLETQRQDAAERGDRASAEALDRLPEIHIGPKARAAEQKRREPASRPYVRATARPWHGEFRSARKESGKKRVRSLDYREIDRGSRIAYGAGRVERNARQVFARVDKLERQAARLRTRETRAMRVLTLAGMPASQRVRHGVAVTPLTIALARRHKARTSSLLRDIERILAELFHVRDLWSRRQREILRIPRQGRDGGRRRD